MRKRHYSGGVFLCLFVAVYLYNASWLAQPLSDSPKLLSHRGVHQTFPFENIDRNTCTAKRIYPPTHSYLENTIESMEAAFAYGADMIELDVHLTTDGQFAVFHDWTLDCRTNGSGRARDYTMAELKELDIGHGYSFDGGETFPFRGKFFGAMPSLSEVVSQFPDKAFLINFKSRSVKEGEAMIKFMNEYQTVPQFAFTGHQNVLDVIEMEFPNHQTMSRQSAKACLKSYVTNGWFGKVPSICHNRLVPIPANYRHLIWGWPHRFDKRLAKHNSQHVLLAPLLDGNSQGLDDLADLQIVPEDFGGWVMTNKIEVVGPALKP